MRWLAAVLATAVAACAEVAGPARNVASPPPGALSAPAAVATPCHGGRAPARRTCYQAAGPPPSPDPRFRRGDVGGDAGLAKAAINDVVRQHLQPIKCCYESALTRDPALTGSVVVGWTIEPSGVVSSSWIVEKTLPSDAAADCIGEEICGWAFPPKPVPTGVGRYPFIFKNGN